MELVATPRRSDVVTAFGTTRVGILGVHLKGKPENWHIQNYNLVHSAKLAGAETWYIIARTGGYLKGLVTGTRIHRSAIRTDPDRRSVQRDGENRPWRTAQPCRNSVDFNRNAELFPIPLLDGGHLFYYAVEAICGKAMNEKMQQFGFKIGLMLVTSLMSPPPTTTSCV